MTIKNVPVLKVIKGRNYIRRKVLYHLIWDHFNPNNQWRKGFAIHHKDGDTLNDHISNLELMTKGEHNKTHKTGMKYSEDTRIKNRLAQLGRKHTDETKRKLSDKRLGNKNPFFGKHHSEEHKKKVSDSMKGKIRGPYKKRSFL